MCLAGDLVIIIHSWGRIVMYIERGWSSTGGSEYLLGRMS